MQVVPVVGTFERGPIIDQNQVTSLFNAIRDGNVDTLVHILNAASLEQRAAKPRE